MTAALRAGVLTGVIVSAALAFTPIAQAAVPTLSSLSVNPIDVVGGSPATGTVTLSGGAPAGGFVVDLSSDNTTAATVPPASPCRPGPGTPPSP